LARPAADFGAAATGARPDRVRLRELRAEDLQPLSCWWNDPATMVHQTNLVLPQPMKGLYRVWQVWSQNRPTSRDAGFSIELVGGPLIGHATLYGGNTPARAAEFAIILGPDFRGQGLGAQATALMLRHGFHQLGLNRIHLGVYEYNQRAQRTYTRLGFRPEGRQRAAVFHNGRFHDRILMGLLASEYLASPAAGLAATRWGREPSSDGQLN